jgi:hypothetical protein
MRTVRPLSHMSPHVACVAWQHDCGQGRIAVISRDCYLRVQAPVPIVQGSMLEDSLTNLEEISVPCRATAASVQELNRQLGHLPKRIWHCRLE